MSTVVKVDNWVFVLLAVVALFGLMTGGPGPNDTGRPPAHATGGHSSVDAGKDR